MKTTKKPVVELDRETHLVLKIHAVRLDITMRELIQILVKKERKQ